MAEPALDTADGQLSEMSWSAFRAPLVPRAHYRAVADACSRPPIASRVTRSVSSSVNGSCVATRNFTLGASEAKGLTSEGKTWRRHRRIMAPAFDHRRVFSTALVTGAGRL